MNRHRDTRHICVFIASPGDLSPERKVFKDTLEELNKGFADGAGIQFIAMNWEDVLAQTGRRNQSVINREIERADVFILVLHRRWGQSAPDSTASSYTEEEFNLAYDLWKQARKPEILVFFKTVDALSLADPGPELQKVLDFRRKLEDTRSILMRNFTQVDEFAREIDVHLRQFAKGAWEALPEPEHALASPRKMLQN